VDRGDDKHISKLMQCCWQQLQAVLRDHMTAAAILSARLRLHGAGKQATAHACLPLSKYIHQLGFFGYMCMLSCACFYLVKHDSEEARAAKVLDSAAR
jgi:hypothetical protein